jgi:cytochrome c oxidase subunit 2
MSERAAAGGAGGGGDQAGDVVDAKTLFAQGNGAATACGACHTLADAGTSGGSGPDLDERLGEASAAQIRKAILEPDANVSAGFNSGIMPKNYGETLSKEELDALVKYLDEVGG